MSVVKLRVDLDNVAGDRVAITECAKFVNRRLAETGAAEAWIACGQRLAQLHEKLVKPSSRGANDRIGWEKAFELDPREFPFKRVFADRLIKVSEFFAGTEGIAKKLPIAIKALIILSAKFNPEIIQNCIADGSISPNTTETEVTALGKKLGLIKAKPKAPKKETVEQIPRRDAPKRERVQAVWE